MRVKERVVGEKMGTGEKGPAAALPFRIPSGKLPQGKDCPSNSNGN